MNAGDDLLTFFNFSITFFFFIFIVDVKLFVSFVRGLKNQIFFCTTDNATEAAINSLEQKKSRSLRWALSYHF